MDLNTIKTIARRELTINIRNKWTLIFALVFGSLVIAISYFGSITSGGVGLQGLSRTSASLLSLILYLIPLVSLMMGALSFSGESGDTEFLFSQPISRADILIGQLLGLLSAISAATFFGFGLGGLVIATQIESESYLGYPIFVFLSLVLALVFLCLSALISIICKRQTKAFGISLLVWFFFVMFYDVIILGASLLLKERAANYFIFASLFGNPVDMVRVAGLISLNGQEVFGAAGAALMKFLGGEIFGIAALAIALFAWTVIPIFLSMKIWQRQDI